MLAAYGFSSYTHAGIKCKVLMGIYDLFTHFYLYFWHLKTFPFKLSKLSCVIQIHLLYFPNTSFFFLHLPNWPCWQEVTYLFSNSLASSILCLTVEIIYTYILCMYHMCIYIIHMFVCLYIHKLYIHMHTNIYWMRIDTEDNRPQHTYDRRYRGRD